MISEPLYMRRAEEGDIEALSALECACFPRPWTRCSIEEELANEFSRSWVAGNGAAPVIGYLCYRLVMDEMNILRIGVLPSWRGGAVASGLLGKGFFEARAEGARTSVLEVRPSNGAALGLYRKQGFIPVGERPGYFPDSGEAAVILEKTLEKEPTAEKQGGKQ